MSRQFDVAVVGATGAVGETMIEILEQRDFPVGNLYLLASERSAGKRIQFKGKSHTIGNLPVRPRVDRRFPSNVAEWQSIEVLHALLHRIFATSFWYLG